MFSLPFMLSEISVKEETIQVQNFHGQEELEIFNLMQFDTMLPDLFNELFAASGVCVNCHGKDSLGVASVDAMGNDVNVVDDWRATMMGNSAKDPFWRAKVSHEVLTYPQHQEVIEDKCVSCHAPLGHFNAKHLGIEHYGIADLIQDEMGKDGVSCLACHQMSLDSLGLLFSGLVKYDSFQVAYGPYENPLVSPMLTKTGYKPYYSEHISDAGICAGCHTLLTETIDYNGQFTGNKFVEQATYHEWLNSAYEDSLSCQACHMPSLDKFPVFLVTNSMTEPRSPFYLHEFVGGNVTMLKLLRDNIEELDIKASAEQFDEVIAKTEDLLQNRSLSLEMDLIDRTLDTVVFELTINNRAGHKFPSGYPSRRAFVEFLIQNEAGDTLFISGKTDEDYEVFGQNPSYEPHYQIIRAEDQVQIYELVMGDVNGDVTTVLERADFPIKDNRIPPFGFSTSHEVYDTTEIAGQALEDPDFNKTNGQEGSGSDVIYYHIPMNGNYELLKATATIFYQPTPPKWMDEMFAESSPEIDQFKSMFAETDRTPVKMNETTIFADPISDSKEVSEDFIFATLYPVPSADGKIFIQSSQKHELRVYSPGGILIDRQNRGKGNYDLHLKGNGLFLFHFTNNKGYTQVERVLVK